MGQAGTGEAACPTIGLANQAEAVLGPKGGGMRRQRIGTGIAFTILLAIVSSNAAAAWVEVTEGDGHITAYGDPDTIRKDGDRTKMWTLLDRKTAQLSGNGKPFMSSKAQQEYDCKEEQVRFLFLSLHSGNMGGGEVNISLSEPEKWGPVPPGSIIQALWKFACGKR